MPTHHLQQELAQLQADLAEQSRLTDQARTIAATLEAEIAACGARVIFHTPERLESIRKAQGAK